MNQIISLICLIEWLKHEIENFQVIGSNPILGEMVYKETVLLVIDNSGARKAKCIGILNKGIGILGSLINVVLRKFFNLKKKVKKKIMYMSIIIGIKYWILRKSGYLLRFDTNRCIILGLGLKFLGTRVYGPISYEFRIKVFRYKGARFYYKMLAYSCITI